MLAKGNCGDGTKLCMLTCPPCMQKAQHDLLHTITAGLPVIILGLMVCRCEANLHLFVLKGQPSQGYAAWICHDCNSIAPQQHSHLQRVWLRRVFCTGTDS